MFFKPLLLLLRYLPPVLYYQFSNLLRWTAIRVVKYREDVVMSNLKSSFPRLSDSEIAKIAKKYYSNFCDVLVEPLISYSFKKKDWEKRVELINYEPIEEYLKKGTAIILVAGHTANWEWGGFALKSKLGFPMEFLYKPIKHEGISKLMLALRLKHAEKAIDKDKAMRVLVKNRREPRILAFVSDQMPSMGTEKKWIKFLEQETAFYVGAERAAATFQYPVFYAHVERVKRGYYKVEHTQISAPKYEKGIDYKITEKFASKLEESVLSQPEAYLWSHKRWKYTKEEEAAALANLRATRS